MPTGPPAAPRKDGDQGARATESPGSPGLHLRPAGGETEAWRGENWLIKPEERSWKQGGDTCKRKGHRGKGVKAKQHPASSTLGVPPAGQGSQRNAETEKRLRQPSPGRGSPQPGRSTGGGTRREGRGALTEEPGSRPSRCAFNLALQVWEADTGAKQNRTHSGNRRLPAWAQRPV